MKNNIVLTITICVASCCIAQNKIHFEKSSFAEIKAKAKKENKLIFIDAYTSWCGPCKWMAKNVFTNDTVADYFNVKFINAKFDMEQGEGIEIAKLYNVKCYPNLLFIDGDGKLIHRGAGGRRVQEFIKLAEDGFNPEKRFSKYADNYSSKKTDPAFLLEYLEQINGTCLSSNDILKDYFNTQKDEMLTSRINWNVIRDYSEDYKSREFGYLLNHIDTYKKLYTADSVNHKVKKVLINGGYAVFYKKGAKEEDYSAYKEEIKKHNFSETGEVLFYLDIAYAEKNGNWQQYAYLVIDKSDKYLHSSGGADHQNEIAWTLYEHSDNKEALQKAELWMQKVVEENQEDWAYCDTYAAILYKLNKKAGAKVAALKAIEMAKKEGKKEEDYHSTKELLEKIEKL